MTYFDELRANWRPLLAAMVGLSTGFTALAFTNSIMGPYLLRAFNWPKADFALIGTLGLMTLIGLPVAGRLVDRFGVRRTATVGFIAGPISFLVLSRMSGDFTFYMAILVAQNLLCMTTTSTVFTRTVVQHIQGARGMALALAASGPALTIAIAGPLFNGFLATHGWRAGYVVLAIFTAVGGVIAIALVPSRRAEQAHVPVKRADGRNASAYAMLVRMPTFWIMASAIMFANISQFLVNSQLGVVLESYRMSSGQVSAIVSTFAIGVMIGRLICGIALDRFHAPVIAVIAMGMPGVGQCLIAADTGSFAVISSAVLLMGLSYGAEADLLGYLVARTFGIRMYGTVLGLMAAALSLGSTFGSFMLSATLKGTGGYGLFLVASGVIALLGSLLFLLLPPSREQQEDSVSDERTPVPSS
jgi:predicted MFS family arabinose efflux permease